MPSQPPPSRCGGTAALDEPAPPQGLWRVTDQATFTAFGQARRVRQGPVTLKWLPPPHPTPTPPRVAFAIGKRVGGAVVRNRIRRRLRAALAAMQAAGQLPPGSYLVGGSAALAELAWPRLCQHLHEAVVAATAKQP